MKKAGLYIHIPFCAKRCMYCNFVSSEGKGAIFIDSYFAALKKEITNGSGELKDYVISTVYIGGGTPSFVGKNYIEDLFKTIGGNFNTEKGMEISIESNPDSLNEEKAEAYLNCGVNRFSIGLQSANDRLLKAIGRAHDFNAYLKCVEILKNLGVKNIGTDIMLGLPYQELSDVKDTLIVLLDLGIPHISAYGLKLEEGTVLYNKAQKKEIALPDDDKCSDMYDYVLETIESRGIKRYEVSNFSKPGFLCRHNINYWQRGEYFGFGAAAHSFYGNVRKGNTNDIKNYINSVNGNESPVSFYEEISRKDAEFEYIMLNLRTERGINLCEFRTLYNDNFLLKYEKTLKKLKEFFCVNDGYIKVCGRGFTVLNSILTEFLI